MARFIPRIKADILPDNLLHPANDPERLQFANLQSDRAIRPEYEAEIDLSRRQQIAIDEMRKMFSVLHHALDEIVPHNRYRAIAATQLEIAASMAIKGITHHTS